MLSECEQISPIEREIWRFLELEVQTGEFKE